MTEETPKVSLATIESLGLLIKILKAQDKWDRLIIELKNSIRAKIDSAESPEDAYRIKLELQAADRFIAFILTQAEGN